MPKVHIKSFIIALEPDSGFKKTRASVKFSETITDTAVLTIAELGAEQVIQVENGCGEIVFDAATELWSPESPKLYDVTIRCGADTVCDRVGFREICVKGMDIMLNGKLFFLKA